MQKLAPFWIPCRVVAYFLHGLLLKTVCARKLGAIIAGTLLATTLLSWFDMEYVIFSTKMPFIFQRNASRESGGRSLGTLLVSE